jgi:hypothetical protein
MPGLFTRAAARAQAATPSYHATLGLPLDSVCEQPAAPFLQTAPTQSLQEMPASHPQANDRIHSISLAPFRPPARQARHERAERFDEPDTHQQMMKHSR